MQQIIASTNIDQNVDAISRIDEREACSQYIKLNMTKVMMTSSNGNIFRVTGHLCGNSPVPGEFPTQRPVTGSFDVFFDLPPNKRLSKQSLGWWF